MATPRRARIYSFANLKAVLSYETTPAIMRHYLRVNGTTAQQIIEHGLTEEEADRVAVRIGTFVGFIWPEYVEHLLGEDDEVK